MRKLIALVILALVASCAPSETPPGEPSPQSTSLATEESSIPRPSTSASDALVELAVRDLAIQYTYPLNEIAVISIESVQWPDSGLGCPLPGVDYVQVLTPGYRITLEAGDQIYTYHTDTGQSLVLCQDGLPQLPSIPVIPGEIQDGEPWMPVDPVPTVSEGDTIADPDPIR